MEIKLSGTIKLFFSMWVPLICPYFFYTGFSEGSYGSGGRQIDNQPAEWPGTASQT